MKGVLFHMQTSLCYETSHSIPGLEKVAVAQNGSSCAFTQHGAVFPVSLVQFLIDCNLYMPPQYPVVTLPWSERMKL